MAVDRLKEVFRQTILTHRRRAENDAGRMRHLCIIVMVLAEEADSLGLDVLRILKMLLIHDIVEIDAGDRFACDLLALRGQHEREARAAARIFGLLPEDQARHFRALWDEFEQRKTREARFAYAIEQFQPILMDYMTHSDRWKKHGITMGRVVAPSAADATDSKSRWKYVLGLIHGRVSRGFTPDRDRRK